MFGTAAGVPLRDVLRESVGAMDGGDVCVKVEACASTADIPAADRVVGTEGRAMLFFEAVDGSIQQLSVIGRAGSRKIEQDLTVAVIGAIPQRRASASIRVRNG